DLDVLELLGHVLRGRLLRGDLAEPAQAPDQLLVIVDRDLDRQGRRVLPLGDLFDLRGGNPALLSLHQLRHALDQVGGHRVDRDRERGVADDTAVEGEGIANRGRVGGGAGGVTARRRRRLSRRRRRRCRRGGLRGRGRPRRLRNRRGGG